VANNPKRYSRSPTTESFEKAATLGPVFIGAPYENGFTVWTTRVYVDNSLHLFRRDVGGLTEVTGELPLSLTGHHHRIAFDQLGRISICYQESGNVFIRQYDTTISDYTLRGPFVGLDPVVLNDQFVGQPSGDSDLILFYLSVDRLNISYRIQRESFAIERTLFTFLQPMYLDQVAITQLRYQLWLSDVNNVQTILESDFYPYPASDELVGSIDPAAHSLEANVYVISLEEEMAGVIDPATHSLESTIYQIQPLEREITGTINPSVHHLESTVYVASPFVEREITGSLNPAPHTLAISIANIQTPTERELAGTINPATHVLKRTS